MAAIDRPSDVRIVSPQKYRPVSGMPLHNNIPGEGRVAHETGTITFPIEIIDRRSGEFEVNLVPCYGREANTPSSSTGARWLTEPDGVAWQFDHPKGGQRRCQPWCVAEFADACW